MLPRLINTRPFGALVLAIAIAIAAGSPTRAQDLGLVTRPSAHSVQDTIERFNGAVRQKGWVVFTQVDHAAAASAVGMALRPRTVLFFGNPRAGTAAMRQHPTLALDLPMRVLVWEDDQGGVFVTRSSGADITSRVFARHGVDLPAEASQSTDAVLDDLVRQAIQ